MLADAIRAETFKLTKNWKTSFFAWLFLPIAALIVGLGIQLSMNEMARQHSNGLPLPMFDFQVGPAMSEAIQQSSNPLMILFCLIGAAVLFAGEYRWETWRLMMPRNTRLNQLLGKIIVYVVACGVSLLLTSAAVLLTGLIDALVDGRSIAAGLDGAALANAGKMFAIGWVHLIQAGAVAAIAAVVTRSIMAALMVPLGLGLAQGILQAVTSNVPATEMEWWRPLLMPSLAADVLKTAAVPPPMAGMELPSALVWGSVASFAVWIGLGFIGALLLFSRQDLSKE